MSAILKRPLGRSPGILVFTHKERRWLGLDTPVIGDLLRAVRQNYLVGMHWGWLSRNEDPLEYVDFHLGFPETVKFKDESKVTRLTYNSSTFIPAIFRPRPEVPKQWDIMTIARTAKPKRCDQFLLALRRVYDERPETRTLVIIIGPAVLTSKHHRGLPEMYEKLFSPREQERISFIYMLGDRIRPIAPEDIAFFYAASRLFCLYSEREGESRVLKEAMVSGVPVVADANLQGGGRQFFQPHNSRVFRSVSEAAEKMIELLDNYENIDTRVDELAHLISEVHTVPRLRKDLEDLIKARGLPCEGEFFLHDLTTRLPAHYFHEPWRPLTTGATADLTDPHAMAQFLKHLVDGTAVMETRLSEEQLKQLSELSGRRAEVPAADAPAAPKPERQVKPKPERQVKPKPEPQVTPKPEPQVTPEAGKSRKTEVTPEVGAQVAPEVDKSRNPAKKKKKAHKKKKRREPTDLELVELVLKRTSKVRGLHWVSRQVGKRVQRWRTDRT